jgi:hypothetical protein
MQLRIVAIAFVSAWALLWSTTATAQVTCDQWLQLDPADQAATLSGLIEKAAANTSAPTDTIGCLLSIDDQIALHITELCQRDGGDSAPAIRTALRTAIDRCEPR